jgi:hypothetical protein
MAAGGAKHPVFLLGIEFASALIQIFNDEVICCIEI